MKKNLCQASKGIKKTNQKKGRPTKKEKQIIPKRSDNDIKRIVDFPELINIFKTISKSSNVLVNVKTGRNQDKQRQKVVSKANMKQEKQLSKINKGEKYTYFLRNKIDIAHLEGDNIIDLNEYISIERPGWISSKYQQVYDRLNILVRQLDDEFISEFMQIVNNFIYAFDQNRDIQIFINTLIDDIKISDEYKILKEWSKLKSDTNELQIHYKYEDLKKLKTSIIKKSQNVSNKYEQLLIEDEDQIKDLQCFNCPLEYFINKLIYDIANLVNSVEVSGYTYDT